MKPEHVPHDDDARLARALGSELRASEHLDRETQARLAAMRGRATALRTQPQRGLRVGRLAWLGAGGALAAALLLALLLPRDEAPSGLRQVLAQDDAFELILDDDPALDPELVDDLEMLTWLAAGDEHA